MSPDRHPALNLDDDFGPVPVLLLPESLEADAALLGIATAVNGFRDLLLRKQARFAGYARDAHAQGEVFRQGLCQGQALAYRETAAHLVESLVDVFGLWEQYKARLGLDGGPPPGDDGNETVGRA